MMAPYLRVGRGLAQLLLSVFVVWQILFLVAANFCKIAQHAQSELQEVKAAQRIAPSWLQGQGELHEGITVADEVCERWSELTGQPQNWSLFAPKVAEDIPFLAVEFRWDDADLLAREASSLLAAMVTGHPLEGMVQWAATEQVRTAVPHPPDYWLSDNEPEDVHSFFRTSRFRLRRYEESLGVILHLPRDQTVEDRAGSWAWRIETKVREEWRAIQAYLQWRWQAYQREYPGVREKPKQLILRVRTYRIPPPPGPKPWSWEGPDETPDEMPNEMPMARWQPSARWEPGFLPIEAYNPVVGRFESLPREAGDD